MNLPFIPIIVIGLFSVIYSFLATRTKWKALPLLPLLKILAWAIPILVLLAFFTQSPFSKGQGFTNGGYGIGILLGGIGSILLLFTLRLPSSFPSPRLIASLGFILLFMCLLYFLPYELPISLFGFLLAFSLFHFLASPLLNEEFRDDLALGQNVSFLLASALIFGVYHRIFPGANLPKEFWSLAPLSLFSIAILSLFLGIKGTKGVLLTAVFYLAFAFALSYFYLHYLPFFYLVAGGTITASLFILFLRSDRSSHLAIVSVLLLLGLFALSFRFLQAYGVCLSGISLLPFCALPFTDERKYERRDYNLFLLPIPLLAILRLFYQLFVSAPYVSSPTLYDFYPLLGLIAGAIILFFLEKGENLPSFSKLLPPILSLIVFSYLVSIFGLKTSAGVFTGALLSSILLLFLSLSLLTQIENSFPSFLFTFLLLALILTPTLASLSVHLTRLLKFYITLGTVPLALLIIFLLSPKEGKGR